ncbi:MAG TPA: Gfo/Idh/MocA family oxidoreductase [Pirellulales bacterium]|jgi:predicted dehydrogenase|nr:Gfo/Idh/MocA family oxidoreductase [Pirellulales bacterium]
MSRLSRRRLLEDSLLAATAAAVSGIAPKSAPAEETSVGKSANDRLSVAVIGVRGQGNGHLGAYSQTARYNTEVTYICDADEAVGRQRVEEIAKKQGRAPQYVQDLRKVFDDPSVDVVSTATPNHWHALVAIWAMQAGKDVYVEKPVSHNVSEGRRIVQTARKRERICQTGTQCRSMGGTIQAIDYVHSGKIGQVTVARGLCYKLRGSIGPKGTYEVPASVDYNLWLGPAPLKPPARQQFHYDWHWFWDYGNGDLGNQGIHQMDIARWGLGLAGLSKSVVSYGGRFGYEDAGETANTQTIIHDYDDRTLVFEVRGLPTDDLRGAKVGVIFEGSEGYVVLTSYDAGAAFDRDGKLVTTFQAGGDHFGNFLGAVRSRRREDLHADIEEGHLSSALCHLGNISYRLGGHVPLGEVRGRLENRPQAAADFDRFASHLADHRVPDTALVQFGAPLDFDSSNEQFVGNSAADALLTREYRKPFAVPAAVEV